MKNKVQLINDSDFISRFENKTLDPIHFSHKGHLRVAWLYLTKYDFHSASKAITTGIQNYATSLGATDKFHATITEAFIHIVNKRIGATASGSWESFIENNIDLVENADLLMARHYSKKLLSSSAAKMAIIQPDIKTF